MSQKTVAKTKRTRLAPHERRMQLLDAAHRIIEANGLASLTIEEVAREAGVSIPLIYKYFDTRLTLLQELLVREYNRFDREIWDRLGSTQSYREVVEIFVQVNFEQAERANIVDVLRGQADIRAATENTEKVDLLKTDKFLVKGMMREFNMPADKAAQLVATGSGASKAAAQYRKKYGGSKSKMIKETVRFIFAGMGAAKSP